MTISRRELFIGAAALGALGACTPAAPVLNVSAQGSAGMNPGPDGSDRPLTVTVVQMSGTSAFDGSDFFSLQDPQAALGAEFVSVQQIVLAPGGQASATVQVRPGVAAVGFIAGFRDPSGKVFRRRVAAPSGPAGLIVSVTPGGLSLQSA